MVLIRPTRLAGNSPAKSASLATGLANFLHQVKFLWGLGSFELDFVHQGSTVRRMRVALSPGSAERDFADTQHFGDERAARGLLYLRWLRQCERGNTRASRISRTTRPDLRGQFDTVSPEVKGFAGGTMN